MSTSHKKAVFVLFRPYLSPFSAHMQILPRPNHRGRISLQFCRRLSIVDENFRHGLAYPFNPRPPPSPSHPIIFVTKFFLIPRAENPKYKMGWEKKLSNYDFGGFGGPPQYKNGLLHFGTFWSMWVQKVKKNIEKSRKGPKTIKKWFLA